MTRFAALLAVLATMFFAQPAHATLTIIGIDISTSSPLAYSQGLADNAATYLKNKTLAMQPGDRLRILSVGRAGTAIRVIDLKATIGNRAKDRPEIIASQLERYFRSLPAMVRADKLELQKATSLIDFLEGFDGHCSAEPTRILLFTDGLEASIRVSESDLASGKSRLPMPKKRFLEGCDVEMRGIGQRFKGSNSDGLYSLLKPQWASFLEEAGAREVIITREAGGF